MSIPATVEKSVQQTQEWLHAIKAEAGLADDEAAYRTLRGVLHQLRDRIPAPEAIEFAAQLPTLVRGIYFDSWALREPQEVVRDKEAYLTRIAERIDDNHVAIEPATKAVHRVLSENLSDGQIDQALHMMNDELKTLWPEEVVSRAKERLETRH